MAKRNAAGAREYEELGLNRLTMQFSLLKCDESW